MPPHVVFRRGGGGAVYRLRRRQYFGAANVERWSNNLGVGPAGASRSVTPRDKPHANITAGIPMVLFVLASRRIG